MSPNNPEPFSLIEMKVTPKKNELELDGELVSLQPIQMDVLWYLAQKFEEVVSVETLLQDVWGNSIEDHNRVQATISRLRRKLEKLLGKDTEVIKNYPGRGYKLMLKPNWHTEPVMHNWQGSELQSVSETSRSNAIDSIGSAQAQKFSFNVMTQFRVIVGLVALAILVLIFLVAGEASNSINKSHNTTFSERSGFTNETGHERYALPHYNNKEVLYAREYFEPDKLEAIKSELWLRDEQGQEWQISSSKQSWFKLVWAPSDSTTSQNLLAVEVLRNKGEPLTPDFYQTADYLYNIYVFNLDLESKKVVDKKFITQWQGRLLSAAWWDETTLELIARQGANAQKQRFRLSLTSQKLTAMDDSSFESKIPGTLISNDILNQQTIIQSKKNGLVHLSFLDEQQNLVASIETSFKYARVNWIPDLSGALVFAENKYLYAQYIDGSKVDIKFPVYEDRDIFHLRYSNDGKKIYFTERIRKTNIFKLTNDNEITKLTNNDNLNGYPSYSHDGESIVYSSVRNNQRHLWLIEGDRAERQLNTEKIVKSSALVWSFDNKKILFRSDNKIYLHTIESNSNEVLMEDAEGLQPLTYFPEEKSLLVIKNSGQVANIWSVDLASKQSIQNTFGSIASRFTNESGVYFQYMNKNGLWYFNHKSKQSQLLTQNLPVHSYILSVKDNKLFYVTGGRCRESDIYVLDFTTGESETFLERSEEFLSTFSFHPQKGGLGWYCYLPESNVLVLE